MSIKKDIFAPLALGLGASVRRSAMLLLVMMLTTVTAWATTFSTINVGGTDYTLFTGFTATAGTEVDNAFVYGNMVDGDLSSSFHVFTSPAYVEFNSDDPIIPKGYIFNTYDASNFKPTSWVLKAKADSGDDWTELDNLSGQSISGQEYSHSCNNEGNNAYKYFRFEVSNNSNNIWLTEIRLYGNMSYTHIAVKAATCTETGIKQECWRRTDGKYFTDETGTTELAESDVIAPMIPHTAEHHAATSTNIEYWTCSVCGKYFSDEACTTEITEAETQTTVFGTLANGCYTLTSQTYTLTADVNTSGYIYIPAGVTATIDLAGHTIDRGLTSAVANGYVIKVAGTLTLTDSGTGGTVRGGMGSSTNKTSCVYVPDGGTFTLAGGTLIGNTSNEGNRAVYVAFSAHFIMTGGKITGDVCGIDADGYLTISGGEISGNSQRGIYPRNYSISISGNPRIINNGNVNVGLYYYDAARLTVVGALTEGANIGIRPNSTPTASAPVTVTSGYGAHNTAAPDTYFTLDNNSFVLGWNEDRTEVAVGTALYTVDFDMNGHGSAIDAVSLLSGYKVLEPTVPTADDWYFVGWYTDAACTAGNEYDFDDAVTSNMTLHALWTQTAIHSITLPDKMVIVSADQEAVGGKYPVGTNIKFKVSSADYVVDGDVSDGTNTLTPDGDGNYTITMGDADITITATVKKAVEPNKTLSGSESYTAQDGDVLTGSTSGTVTIAANAKITLSDVTITGGIVCEGTAEITLVGTNSVTGKSQKAGIQVGGSGTTLTIKGNGSLNVTGGSQAAGIGLGRTWDANTTGGSVVIEGGTVTASGDIGIGTGTVGNSKTVTVGDIVIKGGTVNASLGKGYIYNGSTATIGAIKIYDTIDKVDASAITESVTYMHVDGNTETDVTASASTYFTIIEDGDRRVITPKDDTDYTITIADGIEHGTIACAATTAKYGDKVTITATPDFGYRLSRLVVKDVQNKSVASTGNSFTMPQSNVTVSAVFEQGTHGTTEFAWGYQGDYGTGYVTEAVIYDGVTTVSVSSGKDYMIEKDYQEDPEPGMGYYENSFRLDEDPYTAGVTIPYSGGTGSFMMGGDGKFRLANNATAGFYDITMTDAGGGKWSVSILKTVAVMDAVPDQTYTGSAITPEPLVMAGSLSLTKGTDYVYSYTNNTNVGTAKVTVTFKGDYASLGSVEKEFTITKATPTVTAPTPVEDLVYSGTAQALVTAGTTDFGTLIYSTDGTNYSADIPTGTAAGTYTVYYKVDGSDNWNAVDAQTVEVTIARTYTVTFDANGGEGTMEPMQLTYDGDWTALPANTFTRSGYGFKEWNTEADGSGTNYYDEEEVYNLTDEVNGNVVLYAQWGWDIAACDIRGTLEAYDDGYGPYYPLSNNLEVWNGDTKLTFETDYTIELDPNIGTYNYVVGEQYQATIKGTGDWGGTKTFTFTFVALHHTIVFDANGGTGTMDDATVANDGGNAGRYYLPECTFTAPLGKVFSHWVVYYEGIEEDPIKQPGDYFTAPYIWSEYDMQTITVTAYWRDALILLDDDSAQPEGSKNADIIAANEGTTGLTVQLQGRTLYKDGKWNTLCLPFDVSAAEIEANDKLSGCTLMTLDVTQKNGFDTEDGTLYLWFKTATAIEAGVPYLVKWTKAADYEGNEANYDIVSPVFEGVTISDAEAQAVESETAGLETVLMVGNYSPVSVTADDKSILFLGDANTLYYSTIDRQLRSCRAYFSVPYIKNNAAAAKIRAFALNFDGEEEATGILEVSSDYDERKNDAWYTLDGMRLGSKPTQRGMYINKGKKVIIK